MAEMKRFELLRRGTPDLPHFECGPFNHLGTSPYISVCFILEKILERKAGENTEKYSIFYIENPLISRISGGRNDQAAVKFRVMSVMTTSIRLRILVIYLVHCTCFLCDCQVKLHKFVNLKFNP